jgi:hypothetical protein
MSFICKACSRQRAGSTAEGEEVCAECRSTQMGRAALLLKHFESRRIYEEQIDQLDAVLGEAQNQPPLGTADGSISARRWTRLRALMVAARAFNDALTRAVEP